ncbi:MAG TPA: ATP-binding protein [Candidatus Binatia bacterium]|nr:ATP-binding protein [Candidatus Binatia bacterium]
METRPPSMVIAEGSEAAALGRAIRQVRPGAPTLVYLVVADRSIHALSAARAAGADGCLTSPSLDREMLAVELDLLARSLVVHAELAPVDTSSPFVSVLSHELRTPLAAVLGMLDLLTDQPLDAAAMELVSAATRNGHALLAVVNDLLDVWAVDTGALAVRVGSVDVRSVLEEAAATIAPRAEQKGLRLELALPSELPQVEADPHRLRHVLHHLLDNAVKFTDAGHVRVWTEVEARARGETALRLVVRDTGIGIHPDDHERIFETFVQADGSATRRHGGAGLGLAIARRLAGLMRGTIGLSSAPGEGSAFWVALPCATAPVEG